MRRRLAGRGAIITGYDSTGMVTLSIVNYVVYYSNGSEEPTADSLQPTVRTRRVAVSSDPSADSEEEDVENPGTTFA